MPAVGRAAAGVCHPHGAGTPAVGQAAAGAAVAKCLLQVRAWFGWRSHPCRRVLRTVPVEPIELFGSADTQALQPPKASLSPQLTPVAATGLGIPL